MADGSSWGRNTAAMTKRANTMTRSATDSLDGMSLRSDKDVGHLPGWRSRSASTASVP